MSQQARKSCCAENPPAGKPAREPAGQNRTSVHRHERVGLASRRARARLFRPYVSAEADAGARALRLQGRVRTRRGTARRVMRRGRLWVRAAASCCSCGGETASLKTTGKSVSLATDRRRRDITIMLTKLFKIGEGRGRAGRREGAPSWSLCGHRRPRERGAAAVPHAPRPSQPRRASLCRRGLPPLRALGDTAR